MSDWERFGAVTRWQCPLCDWHMDEPPPETMSELVGDRVVMRVRQQSALPAQAAHIVREHPDSEVAAEICAAVDATPAVPVAPVSAPSDMGGTRVPGAPRH